VHLATLSALHCCCFSISVGRSSIEKRFKYHLAFSPALIMMLGFSSILRASKMTCSSVYPLSIPCLPTRPSPFVGYKLELVYPASTPILISLTYSMFDCLLFYFSIIIFELKKYFTFFKISLFLMRTIFLFHPTFSKG
jgi:hypothetical protein